MKFVKKGISMWVRMGVVLLSLLYFQPLAAQVFVKPTFGVATGQHEKENFTEARLGAIFSMQDQFLRFETIGFHRFLKETPNYWGLDFSLLVQRWFQVTQKTLVGTRIGPGYRWVSSEWDAPFLDFSLSFRHLDFFAFRAGYKLLFHELKDDTHSNESLAYISFEI